MAKKYVLLDDEGNPVRYFDYPADGTIEVKQEKPKRMSMDEMIEQIGEAPF